jgi:hypothetical protein
MRASDEALEKQTEYDNSAKTYTASCAVCGKVKSQEKKWFCSRDGALLKLLS